MKSIFLAFAAAALAFGSPFGLAADPDPETLLQELEALKQSNDRQRQELREMEAKLERLEDQLRAMGLGPKQVGTLAQAAPAPEPPAGSAAQPAREDAPAAGEETVVKEPARTRSVEGLLQQREAVFDQRFTLEPSLTYSRFDRRLINLTGFLALDAIFLGQIDVEQTKSNLFNLDLTGRWGITPRLQLDVNVPYLYRESQFISGGVGGASPVVSDQWVSNGDIGDVSMGAFYQLRREDGTWPDLIANVRVKAPTGKEPYGIKVINRDPNNNNLGTPTDLATGSGLWTASVGLSFLKTVDPAIFFGNIGYIHNFKDNFDDISTDPNVIAPGEIELGNAFLWGIGVGFAVNERTSLSFAFNQFIQGSAKQTFAVGSSAGQRQEIIGSEANAATFNVGVTYSLTDNMTLLTNLGVGLTPDSPDFAVRVGLPYTW